MSWLNPFGIYATASAGNTKEPTKKEIKAYKKSLLESAKQELKDLELKNKIRTEVLRLLNEIFTYDLISKAEDKFDEKKTKLLLQIENLKKDVK